MSKSKKESYRNRIAGAVYAAAIGDAMGATTEFMDKMSIQRKFGQVTNIVGGGWLGLKAGEVTDDTQMSICVMDALERSVEVGCGDGYFYQLCGENFVEWMSRGPRDIGSQCATGIQYFQKHGKQKDMPDDRLGNGGLMRALPCALIGKLDLQLVQNSFTHHNEDCINVIMKYHRAVRDCIQRGWWANICSVELMEPNGCIHNTFNNALYWAANTNDLYGAIVGAVNDGGDADTIACVTGGLVGAMYGYNAIPEKWIDQLDGQIKGYLDKFVDFCYQVTSGNVVCYNYNGII